MTSQRFLNDKVNSRDFFRSLLEACKAPIVALMVISFYTVGAVAGFAKDLKKNTELIELLKKHEIISYFGGAKSEFEYKDTTVLCFLMVLCGAIVAISLFSFAFKKNSVNVYFSMGITRTRLFLNRVAAGAAELFAISFIPYLIVFLANVSLLGFNTHQLKLLGYYTLLMFIRGMAGFAIGAFAASVSGSIIEMVFTTGSASIIFAATDLLFSELKYLFLPGYVGGQEEEKLMFLTPWLGLLEGWNHGDIVTGKKVPKEYLLTWKTDLFPIVFWAAASVIIFAVALFLFKKRKNENTGSFGKYAVASALNGASVLIASVLVLAELFSNLYSNNKGISIPLCIILCTVISFIIFFIAELIIRRKFKAVLRMLPVYGGIALVVFASLIVIGTGYFGTFNKLPDAKDIEYVSMSYSDPLNFLNYNVNTYSPESYDREDSYSCKSSNPEDIKLCIEQFNKIKNDKRTDRGKLRYAEFVIKTKDGKFIVRRFPVYSEEIRHNYDKAVFDSEYFHQIIKVNLDRFDMTEDTADYKESAYGYSDVNSDKAYGPLTYSYFDGSLLSDNYNYYMYDLDNDERTPSYTVTEKLKNALYNDLCKMTYDEYYGNKAEPVGAVAVSVSGLMLESETYNTQYGWLDFNGTYYDNPETKDIVKTGIAYSSILIYPQMAETREILNEEEVKPNPHSAAVKSVLYPDKKLSFLEAIEYLRDYVVNSDGSNGIFASGNEAGQIDLWFSGKNIKELFAEKPQGTYLDFIEIVYNSREINLSRIDDKGKANEIADAAKAVYDTYGDNGRYIFVIYEDGCIVSKYLPEKSLSVLN